MRRQRPSRTGAAHGAWTRSRRLIVRMATEHREWGDTRLRGARGNLGHQVARGTLANVRKERGLAARGESQLHSTGAASRLAALLLGPNTAGIFPRRALPAGRITGLGASLDFHHGLLAPAPERTTRTTWRECLAAHWDVLAAADCFTVEGWTPRGLTRFTVLGLIHLASRRVQIAGISAEPDGPWGTQLMRHATDAEDGCLRHIRVLIHDRDPLFRPAVRDTLPPADVTPIRRPARSPNLNAYTERFVRTIKDSCLERTEAVNDIETPRVKELESRGGRSS